MEINDEIESNELSCEAVCSEAEDDPAIQNLGRKYAAIVACEIIRWILADGKATAERIRKNAHVAAWCMIPELQNTSQVELSLAMGLTTKQDLDRSIRSFCDQFGFTRASQHGAKARIRERNFKAQARQFKNQSKELEELAEEAAEDELDT